MLLVCHILLYTIILFYLVCPELLRALGETSYRIRAGFIESYIVLTVFLFIYLYLRFKVYSCHLIKYKPHSNK